MTLQTQLVLRALLDEPSKERYGLELCDLVGLPSGTIYPILARLEQVGWVDSAWEDPAAHEAARRPRRRFYRLTPDGAMTDPVALIRLAMPCPGPTGHARSPIWAGTLHSPMQVEHRHEAPTDKNAHTVHPEAGGADDYAAEDRERGTSWDRYPAA
ncbi:MAG: PadR family transcriptional regulator [Pseudonocardiaceae bacterium]